MFESYLTGECGGFIYMLCNLIIRTYDGKILLNLRWARYTLDADGVWARETYIKSLVRFVKKHRAAQVALVLAALGDVFIWLNILNII